jgi:hypothetical protein
MDVRPRLVQWKCSMADLPIVCSLTPAALTARKAGFLSDLLKRAQRHEELPQARVRTDRGHTYRHCTDA